MWEKCRQFFGEVKQKKWFVKIVLGIIIILQLCVCAFYMDKKQYYNCDELFTFEGAHNVMLYPFNENGLPFRLDHSLSAYYKWIPKSEIVRHFEVRGQERLLAHSLSDIAQNIKVHNTFYIIFNIALSLRADSSFTKWSGYALNAAIFIMHQLLLYVIGREVFKDKKKALLPLLLYGFSAGGITTTIYIRVYLLKSLLCMLIAYVHIRLFRHRSVINILIAYIVTAAATLFIYGNQPYIMLYAAAAVIMFCIVCLMRKNYRFFAYYAGGGIVIMLAALICFSNVRNSIWNMVRSNYGMETVDALLRRAWADWWQYLRIDSMKMLSHVVAGAYGIAVFVIVIVIIWLLMGRKPPVIVKLDIMPSNVLYIIGISAVYLVLYSRIQIRESWWYIACTYVGCCVGMAALIEWIMECCHIRMKEWTVFIIIGLWVIISYKKGYVDEVYQDISAALEETAEKYAGVDNLFIKPKDSVVRLYYDAMAISDGTNLYLMEPSDLETADYTFVEDTYGEGMLVWLPIQWEDDPVYRDYVLDTVLVRTEYKVYDKLFETEPTYGSSVYYMH